MVDSQPNGSYMIFKSLCSLRRMCCCIVMVKKNASFSGLWCLFSQLFVDLCLANLCIPVGIICFSLFEMYWGHLANFSKKCGYHFFDPPRSLHFCSLFKIPNRKLHFNLRLNLINPCFIFCNNSIKTFRSTRIKCYQHFLASWHSCLLGQLMRH